jgi:CubicO group peptidase (beta-lactamase class C family)
MEYSGGGTVITKKILDDNVAANYDSLMKAEVLNPLKMSNSSYFEPLKTNITNFAAGYDVNMLEVPGKYHIYPELAPDALWTTPSDLSKFIISIQHSLAKKSGSLLSETTANEMVTPVINSSGSALGVFIENYGDEKYFTHSGANEGFRSIFYGSFTTGRGIVVMVNSDNDAIMREIIKGVADVYNWKGFYESEVRRLVNIPDSVAMQYAGTYISQNPEFKITIKKDGNDLLLTTKGEENLERMLFVAEDKFYLPTSPYTFAEFITGQDGTIETLVVKENGNVIIKAGKVK